LWVQLPTSGQGVQVASRKPGRRLRRTARKKLIDLLQDAPDTLILAEDEASLYLQATIHRVWAARGQPPLVRADPSRAKTAFYGTLNLHTGEVIATREPVMNAKASARHLQTVLDAFPDRPLLLLWDRAPWHNGATLRALLAANPRLDIMLLPVAAPDLNPQEHVWKATRRAISHNHLFPRLDDLADRFEVHLSSNTFECSFLDQYGYHALRPLFN
jgi:transposase